MKSFELPDTSVRMESSSVEIGVSLPFDWGASISVELGGKWCFEIHRISWTSSGAGRHSSAPPWTPMNSGTFPPVRKIPSMILMSSLMVSRIRTEPQYKQDS